jgi:hypothetical protein
MGEVAIDCLAARGALYSPFIRHVKQNISLYVRLFTWAGSSPEILALRPAATPSRAGYTRRIHYRRA